MEKERTQFVNAMIEAWESNKQPTSDIKAIAEEADKVAKSDYDFNVLVVKTWIKRHKDEWDKLGDEAPTYLEKFPDKYEED